MNGLRFSALVIVFTCAGCKVAPEVVKSRAVERGKQHMAEKDYSRAVLDFRNAVQADPRDAELRYQLGLAYIENHDVPAAIQAFQQAVQINPKHTAAQVKLAELYSASRDKDTLKDAASKMEAVLSGSPSDTDALSTLGYTELRLGKLELAEEHLTAAAKHAPENIKAAIGLAQLRISEKNYPAAEAALKRATAQQPPLATPHILLGEFYAQLNRMGEARQEFLRAVEIDKSNATALLDLGNLQLKMGAKAEAENTFKQLSLNPDKQYEPVYAIFLIQTGQRDRGIEELRKLNAAHPEDRDLRRKLVAAYRSAGRTPEADALLNAALKKNPKDSDALLHRAEINLANRKYTEAQQDLNQILKYEPNSAAVHYLLASIHGRLGNAMNKKQELTEAIRVNSGFLPARLELAKLQIAAKEPSAALVLLEATPEWQRSDVRVIAEKNTALYLKGDKQQMKKGVREGLAIRRTPDLLIQDAVIDMDEGNLPQAIAAANESLQKFPEDTRALDVLVRVSALKKQPSGALQRIREHAAAHPNSAPVQYYLGNALQRSGAAPEARTAFANAKKADGNFWQADTAIAQLDMRENRLNEAKSLVKPLLSNPDAAISAHRLLAAIEERSGNRTAAVEHYRKIAEAMPDDVTAMNNLAYALAEYANSPDEALKIAQRAKELAPDSASVDDTLGWVLYKKGLYSNAVTHLESSVKRQPNAQRYVHLALAYAHKGDTELGLRQLQAASKLNPTLPEIAEAQKQILTSSK